MTEEANEDVVENEGVEPEQHESDALEADDDRDEPDWIKDFDSTKALKRIREQSRSIAKLKQKVEENEGAAASLGDVTKERDSIAAENLRLSVGYELGLPLALAKRLNGSSREELIADAEELVKIAGAGVPRQRKPVEALRSGGEGDKEPEETDLSKIGSRMYSR